MVDEPVQTVHFLPQKTHRRGFSADDDTMQMSSFCFGKGISDWGPLTIYGLAKSGDIYAIAPFLPVNAYVGRSGTKLSILTLLHVELYPNCISSR